MFQRLRFGGRRGSTVRVEAIRVARPRFKRNSGRCSAPSSSPKGSGKDPRYLNREP